MGNKAFLVGKGPSLDNLELSWFDGDSPIWCLNQSADVIHAMMPGRELHAVINDDWIHYVPPHDMTLHCTNRVKAGSHPNVERYIPELLTGHWANPTCMCALELMYRAGYDEITMVSFDSHFTGTREYADCLNVKSDGIAPFHIYDTLMRRWAAYSNVRLTWLDSDGVPHQDGLKFRNCLVAVAMGDKFVRQTEGMISSFLLHNPDWSVERFYNDDLISILPAEFRRWNDFNKCEIGRHFAIRKMLMEKYDTVVYADGDIRWYAPYEPSLKHDIVLYPHYCTDKAKQSAKHWIWKDGTANIGIMEFSRSIDHDRIWEFICGEVLHDPAKYMHGSQLWLQNLLSSLADCGFDMAYCRDPGHDVARWNLHHGDREVIERDGRLVVRSNRIEYPLRSFHFSSKSLGSLPKYGQTVQRLVNDYLKEEK